MSFFTGRDVALLMAMLNLKYRDAVIILTKHDGDVAEAAETHIMC